MRPVHQDHNHPFTHSSIREQPIPNRPTIININHPPIQYGQVAQPISRPYQPVGVGVNVNGEMSTHQYRGAGGYGEFTGPSTIGVANVAGPSRGPLQNISGSVPTRIPLYQRASLQPEYYQQRFLPAQPLPHQTYHQNSPSHYIAHSSSPVTAQAWRDPRSVMLQSTTSTPYFTTAPMVSDAVTSWRRLVPTTYPHNGVYPTPKHIPQSHADVPADMSSRGDNQQGSVLQHSPTHLGSREDSGSIEMGGMADGLGTMIKRERRKEQNRAAQRVFRAKAKIQNQEVSDHIDYLESTNQLQQIKIDDQAMVILHLKAENDLIKKSLIVLNRPNTGSLQPLMPLFDIEKEVSAGLGEAGTNGEGGRPHAEEGAEDGER